MPHSLRLPACVTADGRDSRAEISMYRVANAGRANGMIPLKREDSIGLWPTTLKLTRVLRLVFF